MGYELTSDGWVVVAVLAGLMLVALTDLVPIVFIRVCWWLCKRLPGRAYYQAVDRAQHLKQQYLALQDRLVELDPWRRFHGHVKDAAFGVLVASSAVLMLVLVNWFFSSQVLEMWFAGFTRYLAAVSLTLAQVVFGHCALKAKRGSGLFAAFAAATLVLIIFEGLLAAWRAWIVSDLDPGQQSLDRLLATIGPAAACVLGMAAPAAIVLCFNSFYDHLICPFASPLWLALRASRLAWAHGRLRRRYGYLGLMPAALWLKQEAERCEADTAKLATAATTVAPPAPSPATRAPETAGERRRRSELETAVAAFTAACVVFVAKCDTDALRVPECTNRALPQTVSIYLTLVRTWLHCTAPVLLLGLKQTKLGLGEQGAQLLVQCLGTTGRASSKVAATPRHTTPNRHSDTRQQELLAVAESLATDARDLEQLNLPGMDPFTLTPPTARQLPRDREVAALLAAARGEVAGILQHLHDLTPRFAAAAAREALPGAHSASAPPAGQDPYLDLQAQLRQALGTLEPAWLEASRVVAYQRKRLVDEHKRLRLKLFWLSMLAVVSARRRRRPKGQ